MVSDTPNAATTPTTPTTPVVDPEASVLERGFPHLTNKIVKVWGTREFESFAANLFLDSRDGKRQGFPWEAAEEITLLVELSVAKRAVVACAATGESFYEVFHRMLSHNETPQNNIAQRDNMTRPSNQPATHSAAERQAIIARRKAGGSAQSSKPGLLGRLFGRK